MRDPHQNIFYYYRGPVKRKKKSVYDIQIEDNTTKSFINLLEFCCVAKFEFLLKYFFMLIKVRSKPILSFRLQKAERRKRRGHEEKGTGYRRGTGLNSGREFRGREFRGHVPN